MPILFRTNWGETPLDGPIALDGAAWLSGAGVYVVLLRPPLWQPEAWEPIYVGQARNLADRVARGHHKYWAWVLLAGGDRRRLALAYVHVDDAAARSRLEAELIRRYNPRTNEIRPTAGRADALIAAALRSSRRDWAG